jgi:dCTP deaminase
MFLSDVDIKEEMANGGIICTPFIPANLSNSSIDLRLDEEICMIWQDSLAPRGHALFELDECGKVAVDVVGCRKEFFSSRGGFVLEPGSFVLANTIEYVGPSSPQILGQISDKSTLARLGLSTFFGAGYIDPGNALNITLEIKNNGHVPIRLEYGMHICQIRFAYLNSPVSSPYNGKYKNSTSLEGAK